MTPLDAVQGKSDLVLPITETKNLTRIINMIKALPRGQDVIIFKVQMPGYPAVVVRLGHGVDLKHHVKSQILSLAVM